MWWRKQETRDFSQAANANTCLLKVRHDGWKLLSDRKRENALLENVTYFTKVSGLAKNNIYLQYGNEALDQELQIIKNKNVNTVVNTCLNHLRYIIMHYCSLQLFFASHIFSLLQQRFLVFMFTQPC